MFVSRQLRDDKSDNYAFERFRERSHGTAAGASSARATSRTPLFARARSEVTRTESGAISNYTLVSSLSLPPSVYDAWAIPLVVLFVVVDPLPGERSTFGRGKVARDRGKRKWQKAETERESEATE